MTLKVYLIIEEGAERVYVQTAFPEWYKPPEDRPSHVFAIDVTLPSVEIEHGRIQFER